MNDLDLSTTEERTASEDASYAAALDLLNDGNDW